MLQSALKRVGIALLVLSAVILFGASAVWLLGEHEYSFFESVFFAVISVSTVGYGELPNMVQHPGVRAFSIALIIAGVCAIAFFQSTMTAMLVEGVLLKAFRRRRMKKRIEELEGHLLVAGCGGVGRHVVEEFHAVKQPYVIIDRTQTAIDELMEEGFKGDPLVVIGDATHDHALEEAGILRAKGLVAALADDRDNLFVTLSARNLNPNLRIVAKVLQDENEPKMRLAGADAIVSPNRIGGLRLASELVRPKVTKFLDQMLCLTKKNLRFDEVDVPDDSVFIGQSLSEVIKRETHNVLVVALHEPTGEFVYNPSPDQPLEKGVRLIVIGEPDDVGVLRKLVAEQA